MKKDHQHKLQRVIPPRVQVDYLLGMADGASSAEDSPDDDSDLSHMCTTTGHRKRPDDDSDLGRTRTATRQKKRSLSQTAAQREERLVVERLQHITSSYILYMYLAMYIIYLIVRIHTFALSLLCYYASIKFINCCMIEVRGMSYALCVCLVIMNAVCINFECTNS